MAEKEQKPRKKKDEIQNPTVTRHKPADTSVKETPLPPDIDQNQMQVIIQALRQTKRPLSVAPTNTPQNLLQQFEIYESGATRRIYFWVAGTWRYATLT